MGMDQHLIGFFDELEKLGDIRAQLIRAGVGALPGAAIGAGLAGEGKRGKGALLGGAAGAGLGLAAGNVMERRALGELRSQMLASHKRRATMPSKLLHRALERHKSGVGTASELAQDLAQAAKARSDLGALRGETRSLASRAAERIKGKAFPSKGSVGQAIGEAMGDVL